MLQNITKNKGLAYSVLGGFGILLVLVTYWFFHPVYARNFSELPNTKLAIALISITISTFFYLSYKKQFINGWKIYAYFLILQFVALIVYTRATEGVVLSMQDILPFLAYSVSLQATFGFLMIVLWSFGDWIITKLGPKFVESGTPMVALVTGIAALGLPTFILGISGLLLWWILWPILILIFLWRVKTILNFLKTLLLKPIEYSPRSYVQIISVLGIILFISISFIRSVKLFPLGFDGVSVYMNISHLIASSGDLPTGFSAYNWSLFMALGEVLTGWESMSIVISHFIIIPILFYLAYFSKEIFTLEYYWLPSMVFLLIPATGYHVLLDEKVDLGFLFIVMGIVHIGYLLWRPDSEQSDDPIAPINWKILALLGWLLGYAIGIKYLGFFVAISVAAMWLYRIGGWQAITGLCLASVGFFFFTGAYKMAYIEMGEDSPYLVGSIPLIPGILLLVGSMIQKWKLFKVHISGGLILVLFTLLSFSPWVIKNIYENKIINLESFLFGKPKQQKIESKDLIYRLDRIIEIAGNLRNQGIEMNPQQMALLAEYVRTIPDYSLTGLRGFIENTLLTVEQREQIKAAPGQSRAGNLLEVRSKLSQRIERQLKNKGIVLESEQQDKLKELLSSFNLEDIEKEVRQSGANSFKQKLIESILTESQSSSFNSKQIQYLNNNRQLSGAEFEEIRRYLGYDKGLSLYLTLPFDLTMNTNIPDTRYLDIGFLFLIWIGMLFLTGSIWKSVLCSFLLWIIWAISLTSQYFTWIKDNPKGSTADYLNNITSKYTDFFSQIIQWIFLSLNKPMLWLGNYFSSIYFLLSELSFAWTIIGLIILSVLIFSLAKSKLSEYPIHQKMILSFSGVYAIFWFLFGNGIVWYAFPAMAMFIPAIIQQAHVSSDLYGKKWLSWGPIILFMILGITLPFSIYTAQPGANRALIFTDSFISAAGRFQEKEATFPYFLPFMKESLQVINSDANAKVYRVGTFFNYHISRNNERVIEDNQLELFSNAIRDFKDKSVFVPLLYENGVRYVLFDLNIGTMDRTPDKSLVTKANEFIRIISNSHKAELLYTDNIIPDPSGGTVDLGREIISGKPGFSDTTLRQGSYVLFKINP